MLDSSDSIHTDMQQLSSEGVNETIESGQPRQIRLLTEKFMNTENNQINNLKNVMGVVSSYFYSGPTST